jgi:transcriptional regulator with XRE-family HTH domain
VQSVDIGVRTRVKIIILTGSAWVISRRATGKDPSVSEQGKEMSMKAWEKKVLAAPGAAGRVAAIEDELRLAAGLTALRENAAMTQRELAQRIGVTQPRVAAIERPRNVTLNVTLIVLEQYVAAVGGELEITVRTGSKKLSLVGPVRSASVKKLSAPPSTARKRAPKSA